MKTAVFDAHGFERPFLLAENAGRHDLKLISNRLDLTTAPLAQNCEAVALFANDDGSAPILNELYRLGVRYCALRSAGYNHVDLRRARELGIRVANVPEYSPYAVAEHTVALMLALNRKLTRAHARIHELNFSLDGLVGFDMHEKTVGIIGLGRIGAVVAKIMHGFGCRLLGHDLKPDQDLTKEYGLDYVSLEELCGKSDIITLHVPLSPDTHYLINADRLAAMKQGVMLINTGRGGLVDTRAVIQALKSGKVGYLGIDVYEEERGLFFEDHSGDILRDDTIARLMTFNNVFITSHQAFLTDTALKNIAKATIHHLDQWAAGNESEHELR